MRSRSPTPGGGNAFFREVQIELLVHDLKSPLAVVESGARGLLQRGDRYGPLSPQQRRVLERVLRGVRIAQTTVLGLLEVGRSSSGRLHAQPFQPELALLDTLAEAIELREPDVARQGGPVLETEALRPLLDRSGVALRISPDAADLEVCQDEAMFRHIFRNLVENAFKHRKERVEVCLARRDDWLCVEVRDDGPGVRRDHRELIFERYTRAVSSERLDRTGYGLGLAAARFIARSMGGDIVVQGGRGGATFVLTIPIRPPASENQPETVRQSEEEEVKAMKSPESRLAGKSILAVDDEPDVLETIGEILEGARVDTAGDYKSASKKLRSNRYDLVILDIMGVDGLRLLDQAVGENMLAVMLTAHAFSPETLVASIQKGAISYLPKEQLANLDTFLCDLLAELEHGADAPWRFLLDRLGATFDERFGPGWKEKNKDFWSRFNPTLAVAAGASARGLSNPRFRRGMM